MANHLEAASQQAILDAKSPDTIVAEIGHEEQSEDGKATRVEVQDDGTTFEYRIEDFIEAISHCASPIEAMQMLPVSRPIASQVRPKAPALKKIVDFDDAGRPVVPENCEMQVQLEGGATIIAFLHKSGDGQEENDSKPDFPHMDNMTARPVFYWGKTYLIEYNEEGKLKMNDPELHIHKFMYAEHCLLGGQLQLKWPDGSTPAAGTPLDLENGTKLEYGQINGLGGDYFGTYDPICKGKDFDDQCSAFMRAYNCLAKANTDRSKTELEKILKQRKEEVDAIRGAIERGESTATAYKNMSSNDHLGGYKDDLHMQGLTLFRDNEGEFAAPSYLVLAALNFDHFGQDARTAYAMGHYCALREAAKGTRESLMKAYTMNAFADHYLGDCFAAGHLRTPRRQLHGSDRGTILNTVMAATYAADMCSKYMHDEDNAKGLRVCNAKGEWWTAYGDAKLFDEDNKENCRRLLVCLQASADEVYAAYESRQYPTDVSKYAAWQHTPSPASALSDQNHAALFKVIEGEVGIRIDLSDGSKHQWRKIDEWTWASVYQKLMRANKIY